MPGPPDTRAEAENEAARLYADSYPDLVRYLKRLSGDTASAEDLAQEAGVRLIAQVRREPVQNARAFLFHCATNLARDQLRRRIVADEYAQTQFEVEFAPAHAADLVAGMREEVAQVAAAIAELPPRAREVLVLARVEGYSQKEIATRLGLKPKTVENHLTRALSLLGGLLGRGGRQ